MKGVLTIMNHPSGKPTAMLAWEDELTPEASRHVQEVFSRWWTDGGGMFIVGNCEVVHVDKLVVEVNGEDVKLVGSA